MIFTLNRGLLSSNASRVPATGESLGAELWPQPTFDASTSLTVNNPPWSIGSGVASSTFGNAGFIYTTTGLLTAGRVYKCVFEVVTLSAGGVWGPYDGTGTGQSVYYTTTGVKTRYMTAAGGGPHPIYIYTDGLTGTIDNVSVKEVL